jgi:hypothetical protein
MPNNKRHNVRLINKHNSYSVAEIALLLKITPHTIGRWIALGKLETIDEKRPYLVHGHQLAKCCTLLNSRFDVTCGQGEFFCLKCRSGRRPRGDTAVLIPLSNNRQKLISNCHECGTQMHTALSVEKLNILRTIISIRKLDEKSICDTANPTPSVHSRQGAIR